MIEFKTTTDFSPVPDAEGPYVKCGVEVFAAPQTWGAITMINCAILWANAALEASWDTVLYSAEPTKEDTVRIANIYLTSGNFHHLNKIKAQL